MRSDITIEELAERLLFAKPDAKQRRNNIIIIGAGASISAGIPGAQEIAKRIIRIVFDRLGNRKSEGIPALEVYRELEATGRIKNSRRPHVREEEPKDEEDIDWWEVYDDCFRRYFTQPNDVRSLFSEIVDSAGGAINWSHLVLGELVARGIFSTIVTTNFDQLALAGIVRAGVIPVVCDGLESLNRIDGAPSHPQLIEIHGSRHTYLLRNDRSDVAAVQNEPAAIAAIQSLFHRAHCVVVVGYGGREDGLMDLLIKASEIYKDKNIAWISYDASADKISEKAKKFLFHSRNSFVIPGQDSDVFFLQLSKFLRIGSPKAISSPLDVVDVWIHEAQKARIINPDVQNELDLASFKLKNLRDTDDSSGLDPAKAVAASIRAKRIAGDLQGSLALGMEELKKYSNMSLCPIIVIREVASSASDLAPAAADNEPAEIAAELSTFLSELATAPNEKLEWYKMLGNAITEIGNRNYNHPAIERAIPVLREALSIITAEKYPEAWARIKGSLGNAFAHLSTNNPKLVDEALRTYDEIIAISDNPDTRSTTRNGKANLLFRRGVAENNTNTLNEAISLFEIALQSTDQIENSRRWGMISLNMANAHFSKYRITKKSPDLRSAYDAASDSLHMYKKINDSYGSDNAQKLLNSIKIQMNRHGKTPSHNSEETSK